MPKEWKVALLIETARGYGRQVLRGIVDYANQHGRWSFYVAPGDLKQALPEMKQWGGTGIIARIATPQLARNILATGLPTIAMDMPDPTNSFAADGSYRSFSTLVTNSQKAARMAAEHLLTAGFEDFAFVGIPGRAWSDRREQGFCEAIAEAGSTAAVFRSSLGTHDRNWAREQKLLADWLRSLPKPIGLMACNDDRGREVLAACQAAHVKVPDEIAVIGVDNDSLMCDLSFPPLTSVALNAERGGFEAASLLHKMMAGQVHTPHRIVVEPLYVVSRHSTNILALDDAEVAAAMRFIRDRVDRPIRIQDVAEAIGLSRRMLEIRFRKAMGHSLNDEMQRTRLEKAKRMLAETDWSITKIAASTGYSSGSYLNVLFQRFLGVTPSEYRRCVRTK